MSDAVAWAIFVGNISQVIEWLEEDRSVIWKQILQLRTPLTHIRREYPELAEKLEDVARFLQSMGSHTDSFSLPQHVDLFNRSTRTEVQSRRRREAAVEYERLIKEIRMKSGFEDFLGKKPLSELKQASSDSPVIIANAAVTSCDALVVNSSGEIRHVALPGFSYDQAHILYLDLLSLRREWEARGASMVCIRSSLVAFPSDKLLTETGIPKSERSSSKN